MQPDHRPDLIQDPGETRPESDQAYGQAAPGSPPVRLGLGLVCCCILGSRLRVADANRLTLTIQLFFCIVYILSHCVLYCKYFPIVYFII